MGIKKLNGYLMSSCKIGITKNHLEKLRKKTIVIDTSIYMYRFLKLNLLIENFFRMITQCHKYQIHPIFVFDGKPPDEKFQVLLERFYERKRACKKMENYQNQITDSNSTMTDEEYTMLQQKIESCKKRMIKVNSKHIQDLQTLFDSMNVEYIKAVGEADNLCAYLVKQNIAWACVSDDMDMFLYNCPFVIRDWNIQKEEFHLYDTNIIVQELDISREYLPSILLLICTDYHQVLGNQKTIPIHEAFHVFSLYCKCKNIVSNTISTSETNIENDCVIPFYTWLSEIGKVDASSLDKMLSIYRMYSIPDSMDYCIQNAGSKYSIQSVNQFNIYDLTSKFNWETLSILLNPLGFVF